MKFSRISILIIIFVIFCCIAYFIQVTNNICEPMTTHPKILFTCTSFVSKPNKLDSLKQTLDSFIRYTPTETIDRMIVINEYDENTEDSIEELKNMYPEIEFINKSEKDKGQARSINLIIDILREGNYDYWLHWEDSWVLNTPFLDDSIEIMEDDNIDQLQLIDRWHDIQDERKELKTTKSGKKYTEILKINALNLFKTFLIYFNKFFSDFRVVSLTLVSNHSCSWFSNVAITSIFKFSINISHEYEIWVILSNVYFMPKKAIKTMIIKVGIG